ncbi:hypothetical protein Glove_441g22 [Diversispora epigaea]|uniref:Galactose oxidase n=1 Tax=Diversispora epigaea TaxID=1348612 RepID=A0A397GR10_9GLOM|nr:hypothetical protein Glove_441g22 [Diversispora epigaea]
MLNKNIDYDYSNLVYTYDYLASTWSALELGGDTVPPRQDIEGVIDNSGIIYIFGGYNATDLINNEGYLYNDMNILNTVLNTWTTLSISGNLPIRCAHYTVNILPNGNIVYIGGIEDVSDNTVDFTLVNINQIKLFDTHKLEWSQMDATGDKIDSRHFFTSVLTPDGYIIVFGGCSYNASAYYEDETGVSPKLAMLDTNKNPFEWSIPSSSEVNSPPSIWGHTANLYNDYMIITFGNNQWVTTFTSTLPSKPLPSKSSTGTATFNPIITSQPSKKSSKALAIGLGTGIGVAVLISCIFIAIFVFRRTSQRPDIIEIPSSSDQN